MIKAKFSGTYNAKIKRIRRLPKLVKSAADTVAKKEPQKIIEDFQNGIRKNNFRLIPLTEETIKQKKRMLYSKPRTPLYGLGDGGTNTYINMFFIKKIKNGYRIVPRWARHHNAGIPLRVLFFIHENGAVINNGKTLIRIPPRPAFRLAFNRYLRRKMKGENTKDVKEAIIETIKTGKTTKFRRIKSK